MKHRVQECLNCLYDENLMDELANKFSHGEDYTSSWAYDRADEYCLEGIQTLINCQLDVDEIRVAMHCFGNCLSGLEEGYLRYKIESIIYKLNEQQGLWEEE